MIRFASLLVAALISLTVVGTTEAQIFRNSISVNPRGLGNRQVFRGPRNIGRATQQPIFIDSGFGFSPFGTALIVGNRGRFNSFGTRTGVDVFGNVFQQDAFGRALVVGNRFGNGFSSFSSGFIPVPVAVPVAVPVGFGGGFCPSSGGFNSGGGFGFAPPSYGGGFTSSLSIQSSVSSGGGFCPRF